MALLEADRAILMSRDGRLNNLLVKHRGTDEESMDEEKETGGHIKLSLYALAKRSYGGMRLIRLEFMHSPLLQLRSCWSTRYCYKKAVILGSLAC